MPNTLAHIAVQTLVLRTGGAFPGLFSAALLSCLIPDVPWILQRLASAAGDSIDPYQLRAYSTVQATLLLSVVLSGAGALFFTRPWRAWAVISAGALTHLLLDASELKWANGVHLFAPWDWTHLNWGVLWPEHWLVHTVSLAGLAGFFYIAFRSRPPSAGLIISSKRLGGVAALLVAYFLIPMALLEGPVAADNHYLATLSHVERRPGSTLELDRASVVQRDERWYVRTYANELIGLKGAALPERAGTYSLRGNFLTSDTILVKDWHRHDGLRDVASVLGLISILGWFLIVLCHYWRGTRTALGRDG